MSVAEKINSTGPKKILALDGGGIRGILAVEVLAKIESMLRRKLGGGNDFVLADYFDFFAGTSTGAIIAACLSWRMSIDRIRDFYLQNGREMFDKASLLNRYYRHKFDDQKLSARLRQEFGAETTLRSEKIDGLLMMVLRNASTDSPWPISNNPRAKYNDCTRADCNLNLPLWQLVRASTAAPTYFPPEVVRVGEKEFIFVDGGITMYNNPAFQAFLMATVEAFNLNWPVGENNLLLVSIGTGTSPDANANLRPDEMNVLYNASSIPSALMAAALNEQDFLCRVFGKCLAGDPLDREVGDMIGTRGPVQPRLFTYVRYNAELTRHGLDGLGLPGLEPKNVQQLDSIEYIADLQAVGSAVAERKVSLDHFAGFC
ncbi:MAG TPA: patatin-like phospholipase family protein [Candidatus Binatia bacterium]|jgi:patatin-like phospholipase/acyl hydrolase